MRDDEFNSWLRSGSAQLAGAVHPPSPEAVRRRGDRRRRHVMLASGVLTFAVGAGGGGVAYASFAQPGHGNPPAATGATSSPTTTATQTPGTAASATPAAVPPDMAGVSTGGSVELLSSKTGEATRVLVPKVDAVGDAVAVSPDGKTVYYAVKSGCTDYIYSVPVAGGTPTQVTAGALPAISPDGTELAFVREPFTAYPYEPIGCSGNMGATPGNDFQVVVRDLASGSEKVFPADPSTASLPVPVSHLSWSPSGGDLLVSIASAQDNEGWSVHLLDTKTDQYFTGSRVLTQSITVSGPAGKRPAYYPEAVYQPDGDIFAVRECCTGFPVQPSSIRLEQVTASGELIHTVAAGFLNRVHSSLDAVSGKVLYLSGSTLFTSVAGKPAKVSATGLIAAAWLPPVSGGG